MPRLSRYQRIFLTRVIDSVASHMGKNQAETVVKQSTFIESLIDDPVFIMHYTPDYWAKKILKKSKVAV